MKRTAILLLCLILLALPSVQAAGFCSDAQAINTACLSVMKLDVKNDKGVSIASASGFVAFTDELMVTNCHVIENAYSITALSDTGEEYELSQVVCVNSDIDIAILRFAEPTGLAPLPLNESGQVFRGAPVVAIGSPQGFKNNVSSGNVSAVYTEDEVRYIRFNAPISSGSSGGALLNDDGQVIGVTAGAYSGAAQNLNVAVNAIEVIELYEAHKDDAPTSLGAWKDVNQGAKPVEFSVPAARSFKIKNDATFSISEVYLYPDGAVSWGKARNTSGWLYKGNSMEFTVTDDEASLRAYWTLNFCFYYNKRPVYMETSGIDLREILGKTIIITIENGNQIHVDIEEGS